jgi:caa(3)-type oxidase subunit IV
MSPSAPHSHDHGHDDGHGAHGEAHHTNYVKIWAILLVLLVVSLAGPELGIRVVTLLTAFGIAVVKAYMVAKYFMHLNIERRFVVQLLTVCLGLMVLFFIATAPDVMKHWGMNWRNESAKNANIPEVHHVEGEAGGAAEHGAAPVEHGAAPAAHGAGE